MSFGVATSILFLLLTLSSQTFAETRLRNFDCSGRVISWQQVEKQPISMTIALDAGVYMEVPDESSLDEVTFYNLDTGKLATFSADYRNKIVMRIFKNVTNLNSRKPESSVYCNIK